MGMGEVDFSYADIVENAVNEGLGWHVWTPLEKTEYTERMACIVPFFATKHDLFLTETEWWEDELCLQV